MGYGSTVMMEPTAAEIENLRRLLAIARDEDLGAGDITSALLPKGEHALGQFVSRQELVVCGLAFLAEIAGAYHGEIRTDLSAVDGELVKPHQVVAGWSGPAREILAAERVALNFLQRLSGIATLTRQYVQAVEGTGVEIVDTRKTTPGWRRLEKYAVRAGGGTNHRVGLFDAVLVKDNHLVVLSTDETGGPLGVVGEFLAARKGRGDAGEFAEVEVDTLDQLDAVLDMPVDVILLDNFSVDELARAVHRREAMGLADAIALEASGGITLETVRQVAETGVDRIAVGAVTHSATAVDIGFDVQQGG